MHIVHVDDVAVDMDFSEIYLMENGIVSRGKINIKLNSFSKSQLFAIRGLRFNDRLRFSR